MSAISPEGRLARIESGSREIPAPHGGRSMLVHEQMTSEVQCCQVGDSLAAAARVLWEHDCGSVPVIDDAGDLVGMLTDRDICMAAYTSGRGLHDLRVIDAMAGNPVSARRDDSLREAQLLMRANGVRRLPVLDDLHHVVGMITCNDLCRWVDDGGSSGLRHHDATHLVRTLATVGKARKPKRAAVHGTNGAVVAVAAADSAMGAITTTTVTTRAGRVLGVLASPTPAPTKV